MREEKIKKEIEVLKTFDGKIDESKDMMLEINIAEAPMFTFSRSKKRMLVKDLLVNEQVTIEAKKIMEDIYEENEHAKVDYRGWIDSRGVNRELIIASIKAFPDSFAMDVFFGLMSLLIKANSPMFPDEKGLFHFKTNEVSFSLNQLCKEMDISPGNATYERIEKALGKLFSVEYYSTANGSLYEKSKDIYISERKAIKIINSYTVSDRVKNEKTGRMQFYKGKVKFDDLIIDNLSLGFTKVIRSHQYFKLKSGIGRGLYLYLEANKKSNTTYIKRSFNVLKNKIPVDFKYPSELKTKLKKALDNMIELDVIKDYFYGDEIIINEVKESCIYIIFKGTKKQLISSLTEKPKDIKSKKKKDLETDYKLKLPSDIKKELIDFGINSKKVAEIIQKYNKWKIAEYILWLKDGISNGKVKDPAAMFVFAITDEMVKVNKTHPHISEFVQKSKDEIEGKNKVTKELIEKEYKKYVKKELDLFKEEEEFAFMAVKENILDEIESVQNKKIKSQKQLYNMATTDEEKNKLLNVIEKWERFSIERDESEIFLEMFVKKIKILRNIKDYNTFENQYKK